MSAMSANQGTMISLNREPGPRAGNRPPLHALTDLQIAGGFGFQLTLLLGEFEHT